MQAMQAKTTGNSQLESNFFSRHVCQETTAISVASNRSGFHDAHVRIALAGSISQQLR